MNILKRIKKNLIIKIKITGEIVHTSNGLFLLQNFIYLYVYLFNIFIQKFSLLIIFYFLNYFKLTLLIQAINNTIKKYKLKNFKIKTVSNFLIC